MKTLIPISLLLISLITGVFLPANAQEKTTMADFCDSLFKSGLDDHMLPGGIVSIVKDGKVLLAKAYGHADVESGIPVQADRTLFQVGSVGKVLTAMAVLKLVDSGALSLNEDIRAYLDDSPLTDSFQSPVTLRHLLSHTAGINERVIGYAARTSNEVQGLEQHLKERFPEFFQEPGKSISYSNYGYALAGLIVERVSEMPFAQFVAEHVLSPLQMNRSTYELPDSDTISSDYATGYALAADKFRKQPVFRAHATPAGGLNSTAIDMSKLIVMLLNNGVYQDTAILEKESIDLMLSRQFSNHSKLPGYTFGFEEQNINGYFGIAKGGRTLGFTSLLLLIPEKQTGVFVAVNVSSDNFIELFINKFIDKFIQMNPEEPSLAKREPPADLKRFEGVYRNNRYNHHKSIENLFSLFRNRVTIEVTSKESLRYFPPGGNREYEPISQLVFRNKDNIHDLLVFKENKQGKIDELYMTSSFSGMSVPQSFEKLPWFSSPNFINEFHLSFVPMYLLSYILLPLIWLFIWIFRIKKKDFLRGKSLPLTAHLAALFFGVLSVLYAFAYIARLNRLGASLVFGVPDELIKFNYIPFVLVFLLIPLIYFTFRIWSKKSGILLGRVYYTSYLLTAVIFVYFLYEWNFIGFHY